jgi:hypothetical protein
LKYNLHIFNDQLGFFTNKTVGFFEQLYPNKNHYLNTAQNCKNKLSNIKYLSINEYLKVDTNQYKLVVFHSYNYSNNGFIRKIKQLNPHAKIVWIFWSHEYYQLPEFFSKLYIGFSRQFLLRKYVSFYLEHFIQFFKGIEAQPFYFGLKNFKKSFHEIDVMGALIKGDYEIAMNGINNTKYQYVSYISINDFPQINLNFNEVKTDIMIGHSGSPILNHYEIVKTLSDFNLNCKIHIPLAYGKKSYINKLKQKIVNSTNNLDIDFQEEFLTKDEYYKKINNVGVFILNSYCQQALGNIFFFLWVGTKVFLRKDTSTYKTLKEKNFIIFSIDDDFNNKFNEPLSVEQKKLNHKLTVEMINDDVVKKSWLEVLQLNES